MGEYIEPSEPEKIRAKIAELLEFRKRGGNGEFAKAIDNYIEKLREKLK